MTNEPEWTREVPKVSGTYAVRRTDACECCAWVEATALRVVVDPRVTLVEHPYDGAWYPTTYYEFDKAEWRGPLEVGE